MSFIKKACPFFLTGFFIFLFFPATAFCQENATLQYSIQGKVVDVATKKPIPGAIVELRWDSLRAETKTDAEGQYSFPASSVKPNKMYVLFASAKEPVTYGYAGKEENYISTFGLGNNSRTFERDFELSSNTVNAEPAISPVPIHFAYQGSDIVNPARDSVLNQWLKFLENNPTYVVEIEGYADRKEGNKFFRLGLSRARALACAEYLQSQGIEKQRVRIMGNSDANPVMDVKTVRKIKGKSAKMAARLLNCRTELKLVNIFFLPTPKITMTGLVTDINTMKPVKDAVIKFYGSDGARLVAHSDSNGQFNLAIKSFNPLAFYNVIAEAEGYSSSDPDDVFKITPGSTDLQAYTHNFRIEKRGYNRYLNFAPITFDSGSATLSARVIDTLKHVKQFMNENPNVVLEFMGDADMHEYDFVNLAMSRALACVSYLIAQGIESDRFVVASRLNEKAVNLAKKNTRNIIRRKESQQPINLKKCSVVFWIIRWDYLVVPAE